MDPSKQASGKTGRDGATTVAGGRKAAPTSLMVLFLLLVLAVYGLWSKTLLIEGTVETGRVHARWSGAICQEFFDWPWPPEGTGEVEGKDVGSTEVAIDAQDSNLLHFLIENGYPSYAVDCQVEYVNDGTIPWMIRGTTIIPGPGLTNCTLTGAQTKTLICDQLSVVFVDGIGSQIDPGDGAASSLRVHVEQQAAQNAEYTFEVKVCVGQWNEPATLQQCIDAAPTPAPTPTP